MTPYRKPPPKEPPRPAQTLDCVIDGGEKHGWAKVFFAKIIAITLALVVGQMFHVAVAIVILLAGLFWIARDVGHRGTRIVIRTKGERVYFGGLPAPFDVPFRKLLDVRLDTKTTSKALNQARADGLNSIFGPIIPDGRSIQVDQSRIELVLKGREPVLLSKEWISSTLAHENIRQIKVFLRKAGWLPADERPPEDRPKKKKQKSDAAAAT